MTIVYVSTCSVTSLSRGAPWHTRGVCPQNPFEVRSLPLHSQPFVATVKRVRHTAPQPCKTDASCHVSVINRQCFAEEGHVLPSEHHKHDLGVLCIAPGLAASSSFPPFHVLL